MLTLSSDSQFSARPIPPAVQALGLDLKLTPTSLSCAVINLWASCPSSLKWGNTNTSQVDLLFLHLTNIC